jgi:hypothetical protein
MYSRGMSKKQMRVEEVKDGGEGIKKRIDKYY